MAPLLVTNQRPLTQRYKSASSSADRELIREKPAVVLVTRLLLEGTSPPLEQPLRIHALLDLTSLYLDKSHVSKPAKVTMFLKQALLSRLQPRLETSFLNLEQPPKHNAVRGIISHRSHSYPVSSRLPGTML